jgi:hypothetical protein
MITGSFALPSFQVCVVCHSGALKWRLPNAMPGAVDTPQLCEKTFSTSQ